MEIKRLSSLAPAGDINLTLEPGQQLHLVDDLETIAHDMTLTITVPERAQLTYRSDVVDTQRTTLAGKPLSNTVAVAEPKFTKKIHLKFTGEQAHADVHCTYLVGSDRSYRIATIQEHSAPRTTSSLQVNGVFEGTARFFCDNIIQIHEGAQQVDAVQCNKNLLLSPTAHAISIPKMEVEANDVSCRHGSATSRIGEDELFYLQSRGIDREQACEMLIAAFLKSNS